MVIDFNFIIEAFPKVMSALPATLFLTIVSCAIALVLGLILALVVIYRVPVLGKVVVVFISYIRSTPLVVMLYIIYAALPLLIGNIVGKESAYAIPPMVYAVVAYGINQSAFMAEMYRSALESVDIGQMEAGLSIGMSHFQAMRRIVIPQAAVVAMPNFTNLFLMLLKGTSLAFTITVVDIMAQAKIEASEGLRFIEAYLLVAVIYWVLSIAFEKIFGAVEKKLKR